MENRSNKGKRFMMRGGLTALFAVGVLFAGGAQSAGITDTKHNLVSASNANRVTAGTDEICVFCHTPHAGSTTAGAPLWNKNLPAAGSYTMYSSTNMDSGTATVGGPSLVCLSCHDGSQAMDNIVNAPGSGGLDATGGGALGLGYTWNTTGSTVNADGKMLGTTVAMLGTDLRNDHPIGIPYCAGGLTGAAAVVSGTCGDLDFKNAATGVKTASINSTQVFWIDTAGGTAGTRQRSDIMLYTRNSNEPWVECGSCHDPHVKQGEGLAGATFLRVANTGSAVCLACHVK